MYLQIFFFLELIKKKVIFRLSQRPAALQLLLSLLRQQHLFNYHQKTVSIRNYIPLTRKLVQISLRTLRRFH